MNDALVRRVGRWLLQNGLYATTTVALTVAAFSTFALASAVVAHFVPLDVSYGSVTDDPEAVENGQIVSSLVATIVALCGGTLLLRNRREPARRPALAAVASVLAPLAVVLALLTSYGASPFAQVCLLFVLIDAIAYALVRIADAGHARVVRLLATLVLPLVAVAAIAGTYDTHSADANARARDRAKLSGIRYAGTHYARYPGTPWSAKPPETTDAEMHPLHLQYHQVDRDHYRLCTTFETAVSTDARFPHGVGPACYVLTYDDAY